MTRIDFYRYAPDRHKFACLLAHKAWSAGKKVAVYAADEAGAAEMDRLLWTYQQLRFIPHVRLASASAELVAASPVWVVVPGEVPPAFEVVINTTEQTPQGFASYERLLEVVGASEASKTASRERYRHYKDQGYELIVHDVEAG